MFPPELLDHFEHPRHAGTMESPDISAQTNNPGCGDIMKLMLKISDGMIGDIKYQVRGCVAAIACGSALTEMVFGLRLGDAAKIRREDLVTKVGGLPNESAHASHLAIDCLRLALKQWEK